MAGRLIRLAHLCILVPYLHVDGMRKYPSVMQMNQYKPLLHAITVVATFAA